MSGRKSDKDFFNHIVDYSELKLEISSDTTKLLSINFIKEKKSVKENRNLPETVKKIISIIDDYLSGKSPEPEIVLLKNDYEVERVENKNRRLFLDMNGFTDKEINVYRELIKIKPGTTISYAELALRSGIPRGARFIGNCMAKNRFPVIIPCHRVIKSDGSTGNFSSGTEVKKFLLKHERSSFL